MNREGLLIIEEHRLAGGPPALATIGPWECLGASTPQQAQHLIATRQCKIGIVDYRAAGQPTFTGWHEEILRANSHIQWLAVVPPNLLRDPRFADLLSTRFFAYQTAPFEPARLETLLQSAEDMARLRLERRGQGQAGWLAGESAAMQRLDAQLTRSANAGLPILISGEVGSGKSVAASVIHERSRRAQQDFRTVRSITLPGCLFPGEPEPTDRRSRDIESRLEEAMRQAGATGGTLVLDEIGDLSDSAQRVLLRWMDGNPDQVQLIAITHMNLLRAVEENRFRGDLLHRLNQLHLTIPPLRDRGDDLLLLAEHFLKADWSLNRHVTRLSRPAITAMRRHHWPGNVRELKSRIRQAMLMSDDYLVHPEDLGLQPKPCPPPASRWTTPAATR